LFFRKSSLVQLRGLFHLAQFGITIGLKQEILNTKTDEIDPQKEKARLRSEIRRMREAYKRGLYEDDEHTFWREVEGLQMQLDALEQLTPHEVRQAGVVFANLQAAWRAATLEEQQELCQIILKQVVYDLGQGRL